MSTYNDLINVTFEDAVTYTNVDNSDILGVILPYFWGPAGEKSNIPVLNQREFFETYPEVAPDKVVWGTGDTDVTLPVYAQIKSFFNNGGSRIAVFRPAVSGELFGNADATVGTGNHLAFKYPGLPPITGGLALVVTAPGEGETDYTVRFTDGSGATPTVYESFVGQVTDPMAVDIDGESTYLPTILANKSSYMQITTETVAAIPDTYTPGAGSDTLANTFALQDQLIPTIFLEFDVILEKYCTATFISKYAATYPAINNPSKFHITVAGSEKIKVFGIEKTIGCNAGVAGAYSRVAGETHVNQLASARSYGAYTGVIASTLTFTDVLDRSKAGVVCVYNSSLGPQIFGVRNTYTYTKPGSYFARANVSRTLAAILRNIIPECLAAIHTDTAANAVTRKVFEANLNNVINGFIATQDLQADSKAICNASNNSDAQTLGGSVLNIILSLHFIGLVEKVNIKVIATDSSVTVNVA